MKWIPIIFPFIKGIKLCHFFQRLALQMCLGNYEQQYQTLASLRIKKEKQGGECSCMSADVLFGPSVITIRKQTCLCCMSSDENRPNTALHLAYCSIPTPVLHVLILYVHFFVRQVAWIKRVFCIIKNNDEIFQYREYCLFLVYQEKCLNLRGTYAVALIELP